MRRTTAESVLVESTRILRSHLGHRSASKPQERFIIDPRDGRSVLGDDDLFTDS